MDIITDLEKFANKIKNEIKKTFVDADIWIFKEGDI
jgi:flagellar biosynthesis regulator FlaF